MNSMRRTITIILTLVALVAVSESAAQINDYGRVGSGARAVAMGGAFTAVADDATAIMWNPGGLTRLAVPEASVVMRANTTAFDLASTEEFLDAYKANSSTNVALNFASLVYPMRLGPISIVTGVAYRTIHDWERELVGERSYSDDFGSLLEITETIKRGGGINAISPSAAIELIRGLSVGATYNILQGSLTEDYSLTYVANFDYGAEDIFSTEETTYEGNSLDVGALLRLSDALNIGAKVTLPYERTSTFTTDGSTEEIVSTLELPMFMYLGASLRVGSYMSLSFDVAMEPWSQSFLLDANGDRYTDEFGDDIPYFDHDVTSLHAGMELLLTNTGQNFILPVRAGVFTKPQPYSDVDGDQVTGKGISAGFGMVFPGRFSLDVAGMIDNVDEFSWTEVASRSEENIRLMASIIFYLDN